MRKLFRIAGILACVAASRLKKALRIAGVLACVAVFVLNLQNAADNYGIKAGKAHIEVLAKSSDSGSSWLVCETIAFTYHEEYRYCVLEDKWALIDEIVFYGCIKGAFGSCIEGYLYNYYSCGGFEYADDSELKTKYCIFWL